MPRDSSGVYGRVIPPGASGYQFNTDIKETEVNGEIDDIGLALTNSLTKNGVTTPTADLPMGGFVHTGLGQANANGETVRFQALAKATGLNVTASGLQALPFEGGYVVVTGTGFNITGFSDTYDGRTVTLKMPDGLVLVNSAAFVLPGGANIATKLGDMLAVVQDAAGVWRAISYLFALGKPSLHCHRNSVDTAAIGATATKVVLTHADNDNYGMLNTSTGTITIKTAGTYAITMAGRPGTSATVTDSIASFYKNGALKKSGTGVINTFTNTAIITFTTNLLEGDTIEFYWQNFGGTAVLRGTTNNTFCSVAMI